MSSRYPIVVQGEASETDSDDEVYITSLPAPQTATVGAKVVLKAVCLSERERKVCVHKQHSVTPDLLS